MSKLIKKSNNYQFYQSNLIIEHLNAMAMEGYKLVEIDKSNWFYEEISPTKIKYDMYFSDASINIEGFEFVASYYSMHIYSSTDDNVSAIINDEELKFKLINQRIKKKVLPILLMILILVLLQFCIQLTYIVVNPLEAFGFSMPIAIVSYICVMTAILLQLFSYQQWYNRSKIKLKNENCCASCDKKSSDNMNKLLISLVLIASILMLLSTINSNDGVTQSNKTILKEVFHENGMSNVLVLYQDEIPFTMQMLGYEESEYYSYYHSYSADSIFLTHNQYHQSNLYSETTSDVEELIHIDYSIIDVKFSPSFDIIFNSLIQPTQHTTLDEYILIENTNVDKLYQMYNNGEETGIYIFSKGDRIVALEFYAYVPSIELLNLAIENLINC